MTLDEFLAALEKTPRDWAIDERPWARHGLLRRAGTFTQQCPITAVAEFGERQGYWTHGGPAFWQEAARQIGLKQEDARKIANGSDGRGNLRGRLLAACGIAEIGGDAL